MDKFFYTVFGAIDNCIAWINSKFQKKKKPKSKPSNEDLFNGE